MTTKLIIDLSRGLIEVEGSEAFVEKIYQDFRAQISANDAPIAKQLPDQQKPIIAPSEPKTPPLKLKSPTAKIKKTTSSASGSFLKELDLSGPNGKTSLREYSSRFSFKTNMERNLIFSYYLQNELELEEIGINHIFSCYRNIPGTKIPGNLKQSLYDTSSKGWIAITSVDNGITVSTAGINHLEHDIPKSNDKE
jgi:hypothetical protein